MAFPSRVNTNDLNPYWGWFLAWGIVLLCLGIVAISAATLTTLFSVILIGILLTICGAVILVDTFTFWWRQWTGFLMHLVMSLLYLFVGIMIINNPLLATASLTLFLGIFYVVIGVSRIIYSLSMQVLRWQWNFLNGFISLLLGILIVSNLPSASLFIIGLFVGIDLVFCGIAYIMIAMSARAHISV